MLSPRYLPAGLSCARTRPDQSSVAAPTFLLLVLLLPLLLLLLLPPKKTQLSVDIGDVKCQNVTTTMTTNDNNGAATTTTEVDALLSASGGTTTRTLTCVLPSDRRGPQGNVKLVVSLRDGLGADVIMNGTDVVVGQPRFILDHSLIPMYGEDIVSFKYFELSFRI